MAESKRDQTVSIKERLYVCPKGHTETASEAWHAYLTEDPAVDSGPVCRVCYVEWLGKTFPTEEVKPNG